MSDQEPTEPIERHPQVSIEDEMRLSYLDYSMSVIIGRALPDVRDGLKPVHRRVLYAMHQSGNSSGKPYRKSAKTVGEVIGKFHPHGDQAVYDTIVRLAQPFSLRYPLVDGQGNFGSIDGDPAAAMRYTEIRMHPLAEKLLEDIDKETVDFQPNYDGSEEEPTVLPCAFPNLLANGADGIAVGMATRIPPHNLGEIIDAALHLIEQPDCTVDDLMQHVQGPDFPTWGQIYGRQGIRDAYRTGRGRIVMRGVIEVEEGGKGERDRLVISQLPFQVNKVQLIEEIANLVKDQKDPKRTGHRIDGITDIADLRDESDREGIRVVLELRRDAVAKVIINNLFKHTKLQQTFGAIFLAIVGGRPRVLDLKEMLRHYLDHRREVVVRRTQYLLRQAEARAHILEGLKIALDHLDEVIALIRGSANPAEAKAGLISRFGLSEIQAQAILDMRLQRLTQLERDKLLEELEELRRKIAYYREVLGSTALVYGIIRDELSEVRAKHADERRTVIVDDEGEFADLDMIAEQTVVISFSHRGYVKRTSLEEYRQQSRGGKGTNLADLGDGDFVERVRIGSTHDTSLWFTSRGRVHALPVYRLPEAGRAARGKPVVNLLPLEPDETVQNFLALREMNDETLFVVTFTRNGYVKRTPLSAYANIRSSGLIALVLDEGDSLIGVQLARESDTLMVATKEGRAIQFRVSDVRPMGRGARGVRAIRLAAGDRVVGALALEGHEQILTITSRGYGKRTELDQYNVQGRGGQGLLNIRKTAKTGSVVTVLAVEPEDDVIVAARKGKVIRFNVADVSVLQRATQGVRLIRTGDDDEVVSVSSVRHKDEEPLEENGGNAAEGETGARADAGEATAVDAGGDDDGSAADDADDDGDAAPREE